MRKPKLRDWFLLLVPVILLAGFAFWRQQSEKPQGPFRLVVKQIRREKLTPLDVYQGLDTKVAVVIGHRGAKPDWWGKKQDFGKFPSYRFMEHSNLYQKGEWVSTDGEGGQSLQHSDPEYSQDHDAYLFYYTTRLRDVRSVATPVVLRSTFDVQRTDSTGTRNITTIPINYPIRRTNEKTSVPQASRYQPFKVLSVKLHPESMPAIGSVYVTVELDYFGQEPYKTSRILMEQTKLADAKGRVFQCRIASSGETTSPNQEEKTYQADLQFPYKGKPPVEPVNLETKISVNGCWPLHVVQKTDTKWFYKR